MLQHENPNIEVINRNLWAVRFSLIPLIPQIKFNPKFDVPLKNVPGQLSKSGIMVLNKDFLLYTDMTKIFQAVMPLRDRALRKKILEIGISPVDASTVSGMTINLYKFALLAEAERRKMQKGR